MRQHQQRQQRQQRQQNHYHRQTIPPPLPGSLMYQFQAGIRPRFRRVGIDQLPPFMLTTMNFDEWVSETLGNVPVGVSDIETVTDRLTANACTPNSMCAICQDSLDREGAEAPVRRIKRCGHTYCASCIEQWLSTSKKCPNCMLYVDSDVDVGDTP